MGGHCMKFCVKYWALALIPALLTLSCQIEEPQQLNKADKTIDGVKMITVTCTLNTPELNPADTKVTLVNDGSVGKTEWEATDEVLFRGKKIGTKAGKTYYYVATPSSISVDKKTASFTIPAFDELYSDASWYSTMFAAYPASAVLAYDGEPKSWYYITGYKETNHLLLAGYNNSNDASTGRNFYFQNLTGALSFQVDGDYDEYEFTGNNGETIGWSHYTVAIGIASSDGLLNARYSYGGSSGPGATSVPQTTIRVKPTDPNWADGSTVNYIYFPGTKTGDYYGDLSAANFTNGFTIKFYKKDVEVGRVSTTTPKNIQIGKYLDLGDITDEIYTLPAAHTSLSGDLNFASATDLSAADGPSNCYIIPSAGQYKLPLVKGNSSFPIYRVAGTSIVWETANTDVAPGVNSLIAATDYYINGSDQYLVFKTPATLKPGNALIAVTKSDGTILWSWHIWIPKDALGADVSGIHRTAIMPRNLGALVDTEAAAAEIDVTSVGLLYQWGRKDPFMGPGVINDNGSYYDSGAAVSGTAMTKKSGLSITLAESIQHPTWFATASDWNATSDTSLWGDDTTKSIYDPCPPGYRVPNRETAYSLWKADLSSEPGWSADKDHHWFTLGSPTQVVFPCVGYSDGGSIKTTFRACYWNAHSNSDKYLYSAYCQYINYSAGAYAFAQYSHNKSKGHCVRCVVE